MCVFMAKKSFIGSEGDDEKTVEGFCSGGEDIKSGG